MDLAGLCEGWGMGKEEGARINKELGITSESSSTEGMGFLKGGNHVSPQHPLSLVFCEEGGGVG